MQSSHRNVGVAVFQQNFIQKNWLQPGFDLGGHNLSTPLPYGIQMMAGRHGAINLLNFSELPFPPLLQDIFNHTESRQLMQDNTQ